MSQLRLGRNPDGTRKVVVIDEGTTARITGTRYGIRGGYGNPVTVMVPKSTRDYPKTETPK